MIVPQAQRLDGLKRWREKAPQGSAKSASLLYKELSTATHAKDPWPVIAAASQGMGNSRSKATMRFQTCEVFVLPESLSRKAGLTEDGTIL